LETPSLRKKWSRMGRIETEVRILRRRQGVPLFIVVVLAVSTIFPETTPYTRIAVLALAAIFFVLLAVSLSVGIFQRVKGARSSAVEPRSATGTWPAPS